MKRLFIAMPLPTQIKESLTHYIEPYKKLPGLKNGRFVAYENLHITVLFLGDVIEEEIPKIQKQIHDTCKEIEPFELHFEKITFAPSERRPHMIWALFQESIQFVDLVERLQLSFAREEEHKPMAHATLARLKNYHNREKVEFPPLELSSLAVTACILMESELTSKGPIYSVLGVYDLCKNTPS